MNHRSKLDKAGFLKELMEYVKEDSLNRATLRLIDFCQDFNLDQEAHKTAILFRSEFSSIQREHLTIGVSDISLRRRNQLIHNIITFLQNIETKSEERKESEARDLVPKKDIEDSFNKVVEPKSNGDQGTKELPNSDVVLELKNIQKKYGNFVFTIDSLDLREGEILGVVGRNGSGKSTLLKMIASKIRPTKGTLKYYLKGNNLEDYNSIRNLFYLPQNLVNRGKINISDYLSYCFAKHGIKGQENLELVKKAAYRFGIQDYLHKSWSELSGGYRLRLELARAYGIRPKLLVLDEPLANLDILALSTLIADIIDFTRSTTFPSTVILSSQHLFETEMISDKILYLQNGKSYIIDKSIKPNGHYNYYNLVCDLSLGELNDLISEFTQDFTLKYDGIQYELVIKKDADLRNIFSYISLVAEEFRFYHNFTNSVKRLFVQDSYRDA